jgi:hypothetical protein
MKIKKNIRVTIDGRGSFIDNSFVDRLGDYGLVIDLDDLQA